MKIFAIAIAASLALPVAILAQAPPGPGSVKLGKVALEFQSSPEFTLKSGPVKRSKNLKWLEAEIDYDVKAQEIDELTFKFIALVEKKLLTGEVTYVNILKGTDHYAVMYISPKALDKLTGGKAVTSGTIDNVWVEVSRQGQILDKAAYRNAAVPNAPQMAGYFLNKSQTPFAPLFYDRYEEIKATR